MGKMHSSTFPSPSSYNTEILSIFSNQSTNNQNGLHFITGSTSWRGAVAVLGRVINIFFAEADVELALAFFPVYLSSRVRFPNGGLERKKATKHFEHSHGGH